MDKAQPGTADLPPFDQERGLTHYERGIIHKSLGAQPDVECLDDEEAAAYMRGYNAAWEIKL